MPEEGEASAKGMSTSRSGVGNGGVIVDEDEVFGEGDFGFGEDGEGFGEILDGAFEVVDADLECEFLDECSHVVRLEIRLQ